MSKNKIEYNLLISCPGDVTNEIKTIDKAVKKFNDTYSDVLAITITTKHWSKNSYNQSGGKAQQLLNKQFVHDCDAAVAIFWTRFGTPTDKYSSGTEEEIEDMIAAGKQVFMYFSSKPVSPDLLLSAEHQEQYQKVKNFQNRYENEEKGIYSTFLSTKDFQEKLFAHLSQHFLSLKKIEELSTQKKSNIILQGITNKRLCDETIPKIFYFENMNTVSEMLEEIRSQYSIIAGYEISLDISLNQLGSLLYKRVDFPEDKKDLITKVAATLKIELPKGFFSLGGLREEIFSPTALYGGKKLIGEENEKGKYHALSDLYEKISDFLGWTPFENAFDGLKCIRLAVSNTGTMYDEDIDISLYFPSEMIVMPKQLPKLDEFTLETITRQYSLDELFGISATSNYNDYQSTKKNIQPFTSTYSPPLPISLMGSNRDYEEEYYDNLEDTFEYDFFNEENFVIVKLHMDYLKHNTSAAFPTILFVTDEISDIDYVIKAKHNMSELHSTIKVGKEP